MLTSVNHVRTSASLSCKHFQEARGAPRTCRQLQTAALFLSLFSFGCNIRNVPTTHPLPPRAPICPRPPPRSCSQQMGRRGAAAAGPRPQGGGSANQAVPGRPPPPPRPLTVMRRARRHSQGPPTAAAGAPLRTPGPTVLGGAPRLMPTSTGWCAPTPTTARPPC